MSKYSNRDELKSLVLGKTTDYTSDYAPHLLQAVPRSLNRDDLNLSGELPFKGEDVWYGYELSWLNNKGKPVVAVAEFRIPCTSDNLIESKSFKLYLNSFNQSRFARWQDVEQTLGKDLSKTANAEVSVTLFAVDDCPALAISDIDAVCIDDLDIDINDYQFDRTLLANASDKGAVVSEQLISHLLKSNCLITNQPDWGSVYISYRGKQIDKEQLLRYLISFRQHNEFHEQCVERIYTDIMEFCQPESLTVFARYTRRGGLDINPFRSSEFAIAPQNRTLRQ
ncbi:NADPH-dependent 7-cyano-7-deazaguanine reductase QueF [Thalassotalea sp. HSM 43]|uniref:NADPH-dependent 7-cyano-7-deazaguanine reductase QueF n=1 Tax=Thalassotalea sp. HSM 43 TaxID=2552945 RepID=UPI0010801547|nr:NADPH-dependent 7-cyano-7-deazaguanine reductase QueF [Thalassotalea sp. HSM 43]QBY03201.1 NADPH-dependent 7-cyano-7-deazaguanine reductase QueF [Thalassotalea sp. HSM 43]